MHQGNKRMCFATHKSRLKTMNGRHRVISGKAAKDLGKRHAEPFCRIGRLAEELLSICVEEMDRRGTTPVAIHDLTQTCREDFRVKGAGENIRTRLAGFENRLHRPGSYK